MDFKLYICYNSIGDNMKFLRKYKYTIIISIFIFLSYILINNTNNIFGIDEIYANSYIYNPSFTIKESIYQIMYRFFYWNMRLGELIYFILGRFPKIVCTISNGITILLFFNLIFLYTYGRKSNEYFNTQKYYKSILISYIISLTLFPAFSEVFIWNAGVYNHIFSINLTLIAALPFRLLLDNYNIFDNHKKLKYIYLLISFLAGFSVENAIAWMLCFNVIILIYKKINIKDIKKSLKSNSIFITNILLTCIGFLIMCIFSKIRVNFFENLNFVNESKELFFLKIPYIYIYIIALILILLIINVIKKKIYLKKLKAEEKILLFQALSSLISLIIILITPAYFAYRVTTLFYAFQLMIIVYLINNLLNDKKIKYTYILDIIIIIFMTIRLVFFYNDFNEFNSVNDKYIRQQYSNGKTTLYCAQYDNKYNYFFVKRLTSFDELFCDSTYYRYLLEDESVQLIRTDEKIRN